jgi:FKBP-type peptidyl-prolyl cis-trans isomerase (trigger factor)
LLLTNYNTSQPRFNQQEELVAKLIESIDVTIRESAINQAATNLMNGFADRKVRSGVNLQDIARIPKKFSTVSNLLPLSQ